MPGDIRRGETDVSGGVVGPRGPSGNVELGYVQKTDGAFSTASTAFVDVTGMTLTVTVGSRPIIVEAGGPFIRANAVGVIPSAKLLQSPSTGIQELQSYANLVNSSMPWHMRARLTLAAGSYTFKLQAGCALGNGTTNQCILHNAAGQPLWLQVIEV